MWFIWFNEIWKQQGIVESNRHENAMMLIDYELHGSAVILYLYTYIGKTGDVAKGSAIFI